MCACIEDAENLKTLNQKRKQIAIYLRFYTGTNSIYTPVSGVIVVQMNFSKSNTRVPLPSPIKETMMNCYPNASITNMSGVCPNKHCLVMLCKVTSGAKGRIIYQNFLPPVFSLILQHEISTNLEIVISVLCLVISISPSS